ncbi:MAG: VOC family protein [Amaricoccus sp.]
MLLEKLSPILPSRDIATAEAFWHRLGFRTVYKDTSQYLIVKREAAELHFWLKPSLDPATNDAGGYLRPNDIDRLDAEWAALGIGRTGIPCYHPAEDKPWQMRELAVIDPDGNLIRAGQELPLG